MRRFAVLVFAVACSRPSSPSPMAEALPSTSAAAPTAAPAAAARARPERPRKLPGPANEVQEEDGDIVVTDAEGHVAELTTSGRDVSPALSPDRTRVLFLRRFLDEDDGGFRRDLYLVRVDGTEPELLLHDDPARALDGKDSPSLTQLFNPEFFPDGDRAAVSVTNGRGEAILAVDLRTKEMKWIAAGFGYQHFIVPRGPYKGDLLLYKHRYRPSGQGSYDECWLEDGRTGKPKLNLTGVNEDCLDSPEMRARLRY